MKLEFQKLDQFIDPLPAPFEDVARGIRTHEIAHHWLVELTCDAFALIKYGAAAVAAMADFLDFTGVTEPGLYHPPSSYRLSLMYRWLGDALAEVEEEIIGPYRELAVARPTEDWAAYLCDQIDLVADRLFEETAIWAAAPPFVTREHVSEVEQLFALLDRGIPGSEHVDEQDGLRPTTTADVVNAAWLAVARHSDKPINRLALKAIETLDFMESWRAAGGSDIPLPEPAAESLPGVLTGGGIRSRLVASEPEALVVTPLLPAAIGEASLDLRLGNEFIVFERSSAAAFDALADLEQDPRSMQRRLRRRWGEAFHLHPGELVLAATLEYIALPADLSAQVITRSSYGRLGLLSATAVQVHPHYSGCLTLELVNLGAMPLVITPGERIAQLVLTSTSNAAAKPPKGENKYRFPTGPEFSKIKSDAESGVLRNLRSGHTRRNSARE